MAVDWGAEKGRTGRGAGREGAGCMPHSVPQIALRSGLRRFLPAVVCLLFVCVMRIWMCLYIGNYTYKRRRVCVCLEKINLAKGGSGGGERQTGIDSGYLLQAQRTPAEGTTREGKKKKVTFQLHLRPRRRAGGSSSPSQFPTVPRWVRKRGWGDERPKSFPSSRSVAK